MTVLFALKQPVKKTQRLINKKPLNPNSKQKRNPKDRRLKNFFFRINLKAKNSAILILTKKAII